MTISAALHPDEVHVLARDEGSHLHVLGQLATIKATAGDTGSLTAVEVVADRGFGPPLHCHRDEDELVVVLDGDVEFKSGETAIMASAGACAYLPHGVPHTFQVVSATARMLSVTASVAGTPQFDKMFEAMGTPTAEPVMPTGPIQADPGELAAINAAHGVDIVGPPPGPLTD
jgi:quercetin dioxygenase-like cupin family protein